MIHAHAKGIRCHRDIKPANIMVTQNRILKISDVGLAGVFSTTPKSRGISISLRENGTGMSLLTVEGAVGTPTHMPPEQFTDAALCDARSDIYSFGVVLYQMRNRGQLPFLARLPQDNSEMEMMRFWGEMRKLHAQEPAPKLKSRLQPIVERCLEKDARSRYQNFFELRVDLAAVLKREFGELFVPPAARDLEAWEFCNKGAALAALGQDDQALVCYDEALRLEPQFANAWNNKGVSLKKAGRTREALNCFDEAIRIDPRLPHAWANKGDCLAKFERFGDAVICLDRGLNLDPSSTGCWLNKGNILLGLGRIDEASKCFANALRLNPLYAAAWYRHGLCYQAQRRMSEAIECFEKSIELHPAEIAAWCSKATCLSALNQNEEALEVLNRALAFAPLPPFGWFIKAGIEEQMNRMSEAAASLRRFLAEPGDSDEETIQFAEARLSKL
jgi:tetratricopeptide (TPR) repeat protein